MPKWPAEVKDAYDARLSVSVLFPAYLRTVSTLAAKPFSKPVTIEDDVPEPIKEMLQDIDLQGRNIDRFAADVMETVTAYGLAGILVDYPTAPKVVSNAAGVPTLQDERDAGMRPYWVHIKPDQIIGWRSALTKGSWTLTQLRLRECVDEPHGEFAVIKVHQIRVLEPGRWRVFREVVDQRKNTKSWTLHSEGKTTLPYVPFVPVYGKREDFMVGTPPLKELLHLNVAHWQSASDQQNILHVARVPILVAENVQDTYNTTTNETKQWELSIGAGAAVRVNGPGAKLSYVEHSGQAIGAGAEDLKSLEDRMRQAGAELLVIGQGQKTRIEAGADNEVAMCALQRMTLGAEDALDLALQYTAEWLGLPDGGHVDLFKEFGVTSLAEASAQLLLDAALAGKISDETLHKEWQRRNLLGQDVDWETEQGRLEGQGPALADMGAGTVAAGA